MIKLNERKRHGVKIADVYYARDNREEKEYDVVLYIQNKTPIKGAKEFHTILLELEKSKEDIFADFGKHLRRNIRKIEQSEDFEYFIDFEPSDKRMEAFVTFFKEFSKCRGIYECNLKNLYQLREAGYLAIEGAREKETGQVLVYHTYIFDDIRARMQYSASTNYLFAEDKQKRNIISNVNRALTWEGIKAFKKRGLKEYDLGGVTLDREKKVLEGIDRFKMEFGGQVKTEYHYYHAKNSKGKIFLTLKAMQNKLIKCKM